MRNKKCLLILAGILALVSFIMPVSALEQFNVCVYDVDFNLRGTSTDLASTLEAKMVEGFSARPEFKMINRNDLNAFIAKYSDPNSIDQEELIKVSKFSGIDLLVLLSVTGEVQSREAAIDELFDEESQTGIKVSLKIMDISHGGTAFAKDIVLDDESKIASKVEDIIAGFKYPVMRGRVVKIKDGKMAIDLGEEEGIMKGQRVSVYGSSNLVLSGDQEISFIADKITDASVVKVIKGASLLESDDGIMGHPGDFVETVKNLKSVVTDETVSEQPKKEAEKPGYSDRVTRGPYVNVGYLSSSYSTPYYYMSLGVSASSLCYGLGYKYGIVPHIDTSIEISRADLSYQGVNWYVMPLSLNLFYSYPVNDRDHKGYVGLGINKIMSDLTTIDSQIGYTILSGYEAPAWDGASFYEVGYLSTKYSDGGVDLNNVLWFLRIGYRWNL